MALRERVKDSVLYVVGGRQKWGAHFKNEWHRHREGIIIRVHLESGTAETCVEYITPPEACAAKDNPAILFKAGTVQDDKLYVCTQTEVLIFSLPHFEQVGYLSLPCFNDLHHVRPTREGTLLIAVTGLDLVIEVMPNGEILEEWNVLGEDPWARFSRDVDYRRLVTTKPHQAHPNYIFLFGGDVWVTRFEQKDAVSLTGPFRRIDIGVERPHDGMILNGRVYFTTVDGQIVTANLDSLEVERIINLNEISPIDHSLGWCRGLKLLEPDCIIVGFSRLRPSKWRENLRWVKHWVGQRETPGNLPTRIACYNLKYRRLEWEHNLENMGMNVIFSIHDKWG